jgi:YHS domain-containing protein
VYFRFFLIALMVLFALRAVARLMGGIAQGAGRQGAGARQRPAEVPVKMAKDPVCGTFVVPGKALSTTAGGETVWFCSEHCRTEFARRR